MLRIPPPASPCCHWAPHWNQHSPPSAPGGRRGWPAVPLSWGSTSASWLCSTSPPVGLALVACVRRGTIAAMSN
eukprot:4160803-Prorocentrum_lima.AAC.1